MYCTKCGKFTGEDVALCTQCAQELAQTSAPVKKVGGWAKTIIALVFSIVASLIAVFVLPFCYMLASDLLVALILIIISFALAVVGLILGIITICIVKFRKKEIDKGRLIASLIMGIASVYMSATSIFICVAFFPSTIGA